MSKLSPVNDMLEICAKHVTEENVEELVDRLVECIKRGVGMPTRVGYIFLFFLYFSLTFTKSLFLQSVEIRDIYFILSSQISWTSDPEIVECPSKCY